MLKNNTFLVSIFEGFGPRFGRVLGRFFGPKMHAKSDLKKSVREPFCIVKTNTKSMLALLQRMAFRAEIDEKLYVFCEYDFAGILGGFWLGFGGQNPQFSRFFRCFFETFFQQYFGRPKNRKKWPNKGPQEDFWVGLAECAASWGEKKRGVQKPFQIRDRGRRQK